MSQIHQITRWRWRFNLTGKWQRAQLAMTEEEADDAAKSYAGLGLAVPFEKIPGSEQEPQGDTSGRAAGRRTLVSRNPD